MSRSAPGSDRGLRHTRRAVVTIGIVLVLGSCGGAEVDPPAGVRVGSELSTITPVAVERPDQATIDPDATILGVAHIGENSLVLSVHGSTCSLTRTDGQADEGTASIDLTSVSAGALRSSSWIGRFAEVGFEVVDGPLAGSVQLRCGEHGLGVCAEALPGGATFEGLALEPGTDCAVSVR